MKTKELVENKYVTEAIDRSKGKDTTPTPIDDTNKPLSPELYKRLMLIGGLQIIFR
ncbi:MAG: hypothetical protein IPO21_04615 [Bacteroidales bacterium]|nr:hypothetical protein [Bacteroidales bacterium]